MADVPLSWLLRPASRCPLEHIEVSSQRMWISSVGVARGELVGCSALTSEGVPGDVRFGGLFVGMMM
jgi:hypothetical protein